MTAWCRPTRSTTPTSSSSTPAASGRTPTTSSTGTSASSSAGRTPAGTGGDGRERQIVVAGCLAQKDGEIVRRRAPQVDVVLGTHNVHRSALLIDEARRGGPITEILAEAVADDHERFPSALPARRESGWSAWVTIQIGCDNSCAFCIVPSVRGREISRPFDDVVAEVAELAERGVTEITLLGQNVNSYGRDLTLAARQQDGTTRPRPLFAELLRAVGALPGIRRVRYTSPHPKDLRADTIAAMAETPTVCEHLHLPLQAGSDRVLAAMHRGYTADRYLEKLAAARRRYPTWPSRPTSSWASPARPTTTSLARWRSWPRRRTTSPTPSSSAPDPAPRRRRWRSTSSTRRCAPSASSGSAWWSSGPRWPATAPGWAGWRRCWSRARARRIPR